MKTERVTNNTRIARDSKGKIKLVFMRENDATRDDFDYMVESAVKIVEDLLDVVLMRTGSQPTLNGNWYYIDVHEV